MRKFYRFIETQQNAEGVTTFSVFAYTAEQEVEAKQKYYDVMKYVVASTLPFHSAELFDSDKGFNILYGDNKTKETI